MTLDPDLRLYFRLTFGRGRRLAFNLGVWVVVAAALLSGRLGLPRFTGPGPDRGGDPGLLPLALLLLMFAPSRAVARLLELERGGMLDHIRMCGRPPHRVLMAFLIGSTSPLVAFAAVLIAGHLRLHGVATPDPFLLGALVFTLAVAVSLIVYGLIPVSLAVDDARLVTPLLVIFAFVGLQALRLTEWVQTYAFGARGALVTMAVAAIGFPAGVASAYLRLKRPAAGAGGAWGSAMQRALGRLIPRGGPPEFIRQLRATLLSGGTIVTFVSAPLVVAIVAATMPETNAMRGVLLNGVPYAILFVGAFALSATVRREMTTHALDLVRITPQSHEAVVFGWYAGVALPFVCAALMAFGTLALVDRPALVVSWVFPAAVFTLPAMTLAEGFQRRSPGAYLWLPVALLSLAMPFMGASSMVISRQPVWHVDAPVAFAAFALVIAFGVAIGRMIRPDGPALAGAAAFAAIAAVGLRTQTPPFWPNVRLFGGLLAIGGSFVAEERAVPTDPRRRLAIVMASAFVVGALLAWGAGAVMPRRPFVVAGAGGSWPAILSTGGGVALAAGAGLLIHEIAWQVPAASLFFRTAILVVLGRAPLAMLLQDPRRMPPPLAVFLRSEELIALAVAFAVAWAFHARRRRAASQ